MKTATGLGDPFRELMTGVNECRELARQRLCAKPRNEKAPPIGAGLAAPQWTASPSLGCFRCNSSIACMIRIHNLSVATSERWRDKDTGERREKTEWHQVVIWKQNLAEIAEKYLKKDSKVYLEGQLQTRKCCLLAVVF